MIACMQTKRRILGTLIERSEYAGSYRGELPGMLAIRLFLLAVEEYHNTISDGNEVCCDNKRALFTFEKKSKRVPTGKTNTDVHRVLRTINLRTKSNFIQHHVKAHQDEYTQFQDLSYEAQLNCYCNSLAKEEIEEYWINTLKAEEEGDTALPIRHSLPLELVRVSLNGVKQTTDVGKGLKQDIGRQQAKEFYAKMEFLTPRVFNAVNWEALDLALKVKPKMYNLWYRKQCSGWCATNYKLKAVEENGQLTLPEL